jgi:hypothetical protein
MTASLSVAANTAPIADPAPTDAASAGVVATLVEFVAIVALGIAARAYLHTTAAGVLNSDGAVWGLLALHILRGEHWLVHPGQNYVGTTDAYPTAALFWAFGPSLPILKASGVVITLGASVVLFAILRPHGLRVAALGAGILWVFSWSVLVQSTLTYLGSPGGLVATLAALGMCSRQLESTVAHSRRRSVELFALGFSCGFAIWQHPVNAAPLGVALLWVAWFRRRQLARIVGLVAAGGALGIAPWILFFARWGFEHESLKGWPHAPYAARLWNTTIDFIPRTFGVPIVGSWLEGTPAMLGRVAVLAVLVAVCAGLIKSRTPSALLVLYLLVLTPWIVALSGGTYVILDIRYMYWYPAVVTWGVVLAWGNRLNSCLPRRGAVLAAAFAWICVVSIPLTIQPTALRGVDPAGSVEAVIERLRTSGIVFAQTEYAIAYRITFLSNESVIATPFDFVRFPAYDAEALGSPRIARVVITDSGWHRAMEDWLGAIRDPTGAPMFPSERVGLYTIYAPGR